MPRVARAVAVGVPHHVTQRGNRGQDVFFNADDYQQYLVLLGQYARKHGLDVWAYCLMTNHVHLVAVPTTGDALARVLRPLQMRHAQRLNAERGWQGHLWHSRYYSCALDDPHLWAAVRYVERNPVRAGLGGVASDYPWSSAAVHCDVRTDPLLSQDMPLLKAIDDWASRLAEPDDESEIRRLRRRTMEGLPCGDASFVAAMEMLTGRTLTRKPRGRPRKGK